MLRDEIAKLGKMKKIVVITVVVGALRTIKTTFEKYTESLE